MTGAGDEDASAVKSTGPGLSGHGSGAVGAGDVMVGCWANARKTGVPTVPEDTGR